MKMKKITTLVLASSLMIGSTLGMISPTEIYAADAVLVENDGANNSMQSADNFVIAGAGTYEYQGTVASDNLDFVKVTFNNAGIYNITIDNPTDLEKKDGFKHMFRVFDMSGNRLFDLNDYSDIDFWNTGIIHNAGESIYIQVLNKNTYCENNNHAYTLTITEDESQNYETESNDDYEIANVLTDGVTITGKCLPMLDKDYYRIDVPAGKYATISFGPDAKTNYNTIYRGWDIGIYDLSTKQLVSSMQEVKASTQVFYANESNLNLYEGSYAIVVARAAVGNSNPYNITANFGDYTAPTIKKPSTKKKTITVKWDKKSEVTGYEVQYSTKKNFKKAKTVNVKDNSSSKKIKKLKAGKKYYVRVRAYVTINNKNYYTGWSTSKNIKVK